MALNHSVPTSEQINATAVRASLSNVLNPLSNSQTTKSLLGTTITNAGMKIAGVVLCVGLGALIVLSARAGNTTANDAFDAATNVSATDLTLKPTPLDSIAGSPADPSSPAPVTLPYEQLLVSNDSSTTTTLTINGEAMDVPPNSTVQKTITTPDGTTTITSTTSQGSATNNSYTSTNLNVSNRSSSYSYGTGGTYRY